MFAEREYEIVGRVLGYGVAPVAFAGLVVLSFLRLSHAAGRWVGLAYLLLAGAALAGNVYLEARRVITGSGASFYPAVLSLAGLPALLLLLGPRAGWWTLAAVPVVLAADFVGQARLGRAWGRAYRRRHSGGTD